MPFLVLGFLEKLATARLEPALKRLRVRSLNSFPKDPSYSVKLGVRVGAVKALSLGQGVRDCVSID